MHVIVVGCGRVGSELAANLDNDGHSVAVIDKHKNSFRRLPERWSGRAVHGLGFDRDHLDQAGIDEADAVAAVTSGDNSNILTARIARETFEVPRVVARIYDPRRAAIYQRLGMTTVATVAWTTDQVLRRLLPTETPAEWTDPSASVSLVERAVPQQWAGHPLGDLEEHIAGKVVAVGRLGKALVPTPATVAQQGDLLYVAVTTDNLAALDKTLATSPAGRH